MEEIKRLAELIQEFGQSPPKMRTAAPFDGAGTAGLQFRKPGATIHAIHFCVVIGGAGA
jgi:hypothetical protein